ncbi:M23 family metallopeptidase [Pleionea sediminis]|uniref:M23 family metallopeptidase n=1 Tax=Pleionea sediminis TaxID=2569479 RepID=UPI0013DDBE2F|nr:M23 family metallopeptidase [Pleionea sediminis]
MKLLKHTGCLLAAVLCASASAELYNMPFKGQNFSDNEKLYTRDHAVTTSQQHGYDISARRYDFTNDRWTSVYGTVDAYKNNPTNSKKIVYNKPIYAMRSGKIVGCWRNAPENPRPKLSGDSDRTKPWLHSDFKAGLIPGGGNMLWVEHTDGTRMLYAHMIPGTISSQLCPNNDSIYPAPLNGQDSFTYVGVDEADQVTIQKGQYLGRVGNSGSSTGPHLHIHLQNSNGVGQKIYFSRGISSPISNSNPYGTWTRFAGDTIPSGSRLLWAPRTVGSQYVRHGFGSAGFQALFDHLADSGYKMTWVDGYNVGSRTYYNMIWRPANISWRAYVGRSSTSYQNAFDDAIEDGYVPVHVDSHKSAYGPRFSVIFEKKNKTFLARHDISYSQHITAMNQAKNLGLSPVSVSVLSNNGQRRYTTLYDKTNIGQWTISSQINSSSYQDKVMQQDEQGKRPVYLNAYMHNNNAYYTAIFAQYPFKLWTARHGQTSGGFQNYFNSYTSNGYLTDVIAGIDGYNYHRFAGVWTKNFIIQL